MKEHLRQAKDLRLSAQQVADRLGVGERTVRRWIERGLLPAEKQGRTFRIRPADLKDIAGATAPSRVRVVEALAAREDYEHARLALERLQGRYDELKAQLAETRRELEAERQRRQQFTTPRAA